MMAFLKRNINNIYKHHRYYCTTSGKSARIIHLLKEKPVKSNVIVKGWVKAIRKMSKNATFIDINDGSTLKPLQVVLFKQKPPTNLSFHSSVEIHGTLEESKYAGQEVELLATQCNIIGGAEPTSYPFELFKDTTTGEDIRMRRLPHFRARNKSVASMLRVRSQMKSSIFDYFNKNGFINIDTPLITSNNCEGGGEIFYVKSREEEYSKKESTDQFFRKPAYLTVSGQLHLEAAASGLSKVFNFCPAFRAENALSHRHLSEFWMIEAEEAFLEGAEGEAALIDRIESLITFTLNDVINEMEEDVDFHWKNNTSVKEIIMSTLSNKFNILTYAEAIKILNKHKDKFKKPVKEGKSLMREHELFLTSYLNNRPLFVTRWPKNTKGFYACQTTDPDLVYGVELLMPVIGELVGGGLREYRIDVLENSINNLNSLEWYSDLRKWGMAPSGGFGVGFERLIQYLLGIDNIKDTVSFPRWKGNCFG